MHQTKAPKSGPSTLPRPDTRDALLDAAERLFAERGYAAVGVRDIVEAAGANIAAVNYHFGSKSDLYIHTVRRALERSGSDELWSTLAPNGSPEHAAASIVGFVRAWLARMLSADQPSVACNLMVREASQPSEVVDAIIGNFIRPNQRRLADVIAIVNPTLSPAERRLHAESIIGQALHYRMFGHFLERAGVIDVTDCGDLRRVADHISRTVLRAIGCSDAVIRAAFDANALASEADAGTETVP